MNRYRFGDFILSPRRRVLTRSGRELPLIPRYFDLLLFLVEHRHEAVHRRDIFERVWSDVVVSDSALSQAIRTIRRTLGDDSREPRFIRTVSRHGYQFVLDVLVEDDDGIWLQEERDPAAVAAPLMAADPIEPLLARLMAVPSTDEDAEEQREAAERLHTLSTSEALARLGSRPGYARARALLRDTRWEVPAAGPVPLLGGPAPAAVAFELIRLRFGRTARIVALRWAGGSIGGALAGIAAGIVGGLVLVLAPGSAAPAAVVPVLAAIGAVCGAIGGAGVGAGLSVAEASTRSGKTFALVVGGAMGGGAVGTAVQWIGRWTLATVVGIGVNVGGAIEGIVIGSAAGLGYALATSPIAGGLPAPTGVRRFRAAALTALCSGVAALGLALTGHPLVGGTVHAIARAAHGAQVSLTPLGRLIGEPDFGPVSQAVIGAGEGTLFGLGLVLGLTRRPRSRRSHRTLTSR